MPDDDLKDLMGRVAQGAPEEDLTAVSWADGRRRARRQTWTVGSLGGIAAAAAVVGAWSLGGGSTGALPGPAVDGGVDDAAVTSTPPEQELVPYRVVFKVTEGEARPDGPVDDWSDLAGVTVQASELAIETEEGVARAGNPLSPLGLGGPMTFEPGGGVVSSNGCQTARWAQADIVDGVLRTEGMAFLQDEVVEDCQPGYPYPEALMLDESTIGSDQRPTTTPADLRWEGGDLVATGTTMVGAVLMPTTADSGAGRRWMNLADVPPERLSSRADLPATEETHPPASTPMTVEGTWYLLDLRGIQAEPTTGPVLRFDGDTWSVETCGVRHSAPGTVVDGAISIKGPWVVEAVDGRGCPDLPWQDLTTWERFLDAGPTTLLLEDGEHRGLVLEGELPP